MLITKLLTPTLLLTPNQKIIIMSVLAGLCAGFSSSCCCGTPIKINFQWYNSMFFFNPLWSGVYIKYHKLFIIWLGLSWLNYDMFGDFTLAKRPCRPSLIFSFIISLFSWLAMHDWARLGSQEEECCQGFV